MDGWHQRNQTHKKDKVNSGPYFIRALQWNNKVTVSTIFGKQGWISGESTRLAATNVAQVQTLMLKPYTAISRKVVHKKLTHDNSEK